MLYVKLRLVVQWYTAIWSMKMTVFLYTYGLVMSGRLEHWEEHLQWSVPVSGIANCPTHTPQPRMI